MRYDHHRSVEGALMITDHAIVGTLRDHAMNYPKRKGGIDPVYPQQQSISLGDKSIVNKYSDEHDDHAIVDLLLEVSDGFVDLSNLASTAQIIYSNERSHDEISTTTSNEQQSLERPSTSTRMYPSLLLVEEIPEVEIDACFTAARNDSISLDRRSPRNHLRLLGSQSSSTRSIYDTSLDGRSSRMEMEPPSEMHRSSFRASPAPVMQRRSFARQDSFQSHGSHDYHDYRTSSLSSVSHSTQYHTPDGPGAVQSNFALNRLPAPMQRGSSFRRRGSHDSSSMQEIPYRGGSTHQYLDARSQHSSLGPRSNVISEHSILEEPDPRSNGFYADVSNIRSNGYPTHGDDHYSNVSRYLRYNQNDMRSYGNSHAEYHSERHIRSYPDNHWNSGSSHRPSYDRQFSHQPPPSHRESHFMPPSESNHYPYPSRTSFAESSERSMAMRSLAQTTSRASFTRPPSNEQRRTIEISPGLFATIRGAEETKRAIARNFVIHPDCMSCNINLTCIADADYVLCPDCKVISPSGTSIANSDDMEGGGGVGLGLRTR